MKTQLHTTRSFISFTLGTILFLAQAKAGLDGGPTQIPTQTQKVAQALSPSPSKVFGHYVGRTTNGQEIEILIENNVIDPYEHEPDLIGLYAYQKASRFSDGAFTCTSTYEHNGQFIQSCRGFYYIIEEVSDSSIAGRIFTNLKRYDNTGKLILPPLAEFTATKKD